MKKIIKITTIMLVFAMLMPLALSSCILGNEPEEHDLIANWKRAMKNKDGEIEFTAKLFFQDVGLSWAYDLNISVKEGKIYLNNVLYDQILYIETDGLIFEKGFLDIAAIQDEKNGTSIADTLNKLDNMEYCYIIKTQENRHFGEKIAIYELGDAFYFVSFYKDDVVLRIHSANIN